MLSPVRRRVALQGALASLVLLAASVARAEDTKASDSKVSNDKTPNYEAIVAAADRSDADRQTDQRRQPAKMLAFAGVQTGMKILDMEASAGYSTELLARTVGPAGTVYAQDSAAVIERSVKDKFDIR